MNDGKGGQPRANTVRNMPNRTILLVEDNADDVFFMRRALKKAGIAALLQVVEDGQEAIHYLSGQGDYSDRQKAPLPSLVLLDLKMPRKSGLEVLEWVRRQPELGGLVVIVLTSSRQSKDVAAAARLGANSFLVKPPNVDELTDLMTVVLRYWWENDLIVATTRKPETL